MQRFDVPLFSRDSGLGVLVDALRRRLEKQTESRVAAEVEKRGASLTFSIEAHTLYMQALIAGDRALLERLVRLAQTHDMPKKNAEHTETRAGW